MFGQSIPAELFNDTRRAAFELERFLNIHGHTVLASPLGFARMPRGVSLRADFIRSENSASDARAPELGRFSVIPKLNREVTHSDHYSINVWVIDDPTDGEV